MDLFSVNRLQVVIQKLTVIFMPCVDGGVMTIPLVFMFIQGRQQHIRYLWKTLKNIYYELFGLFLYKSLFRFVSSAAGHDGAGCRRVLIIFHHDSSWMSLTTAPVHQFLPVRIPGNR
jgi:hypothetical protein